MKTMVGLLVGMVLLAGGCGRQAWQTVAADDGSYTVMMPGTPKASTDTRAVPMGNIEIHMQDLSTKDVEYTVGYTQFPAAAAVPANVGADAIFDGGRNAVVTSKGARVIHEEKGTIGGFPSRTTSLQFASAEMGADVTLRLDMVYAKGRLYLVQTASRTNGPASADEDATKFHQSFALSVH